MDWLVVGLAFATIFAALAYASRPPVTPGRKQVLVSAFMALNFAAAGLMSLLIPKGMLSNAFQGFFVLVGVCFLVADIRLSRRKGSMSN